MITANSRKKKYNDKDWDTIELPGSISLYSLERKGHISGIAWLRKKIFIPENCFNGGAGLVAGKTGNADETYINGVLAGKTGRFPPGEDSRWNMVRHYFVPGPLLVRGRENSIAVRVYYTIYGEMSGPLAFMDYKGWEASRLKELFKIILIYAVIAVGGVLGAVFLVIFFKKTAWREYGFFVLQLVPGFFVIFESAGIMPFSLPVPLRVQILGFMWSALVAFHLMFLHRIYGLERKRAEYGLLALLCINTAVIFSAGDISSSLWRGIFVISSITPLALYNISIHFQQLYFGHVYAKFLVVPGIVLSLGAAHDGLTYLKRFGVRGLALEEYTFDTVIFGYCAVMMIIGAAILLVHRFIFTVSEADRLRSNLKENVERAARGLTKKGGSDGKGEDITGPAREKMVKAVEYIQKNFKEEISRENLAASLDMHHDYFGRLFRQYTGKKISDYIRELRINYALELLEDSEKNIIHIAYDTGFETLRTFNRAFMRIMNVTPTEYRNKISLRN